MQRLACHRSDKGFRLRSTEIFLTVSSSVKCKEQGFLTYHRIADRCILEVLALSIRNNHI